VIPRTLIAERVIVHNKALLPVLEGERAPDELTEAEMTQMYLKTSSPEALYMCVESGPKGRRWRRLPWGKS
jgi:hypothetical protein